MPLAMAQATFRMPLPRTMLLTADGIVTIARLDAPDKITVLPALTTKPGSSVFGLDGKKHKNDIRLVGSHGANSIPVSSKILVYGM